MGAVAILAVELLLKTRAAGASNVLAIAPDADTGLGAALKVAAAAVVVLATTPAAVLAALAGCVVALLDGSRGGSGETGGRLTEVAGGSGSRRRAVERGLDLGCLAGAEVGGDVSGAAGVEGNAS